MPRTRSLGACAVCALLALGSPAVAWGQNGAEFELAFAAGFPVGELEAGIGQTAWGASFYGARQLRGSAVSLGGRLAFSTYGSERSEELAGHGPGTPTGVTYRYDLLTAHLVVRVQPRASRLTPFLEVQAGIHHFFTQAYDGGATHFPAVVGDAVVLLQDDGSSTLRSSVAPSIGVGGGLKLKLFRFGGSRAVGRAPLTLLLDLQGRYLRGGTAEYLAPGGLSYEDDRLVLSRRRSSTDLLFVSLGLAVRGAVAAE